MIRHKIQHTEAVEPIKRTLYTSYFSHIEREYYLEERCFAISRGVPHGYKGLRYEDLAPSEGLLCIWRNIKGYGWPRFVEAYKRECLNHLDPWKVYNDIGEDSILICWEGPMKPCHRHIVADWLMENIPGLVVIEI
jgi:hypothetical protein